MEKRYAKPYRETPSSIPYAEDLTTSEELFLGVFYDGIKNPDLYEEAYSVAIDNDIHYINIDFNNLLLVDQMYAELGIVRYTTDFIPDPTGSIYIKIFAGDFCKCEYAHDGKGFSSFQVVVFDEDFRPKEPSVMVPILGDLGLRLGEYDGLVDDDMTDMMWPCLPYYTHDEIVRLLFEFI